MGKKTVALVVWLCLLASSAGAVCYMVRVHEHSGFSDAGFISSVVVLKSQLDVDGLIETDHFEQVIAAPNIVQKLNGQYGVANYRRAFSSRGNFPIIAAAEIAMSLGPGRESHTLALGDVWDDPIVRRLQGTNNQQALIRRLNELGVLAIAAHSSIGRMGLGDHPVSKDYSYDKAHAEGINGVEFFNDEDLLGIKDNGEETLRWYLSLLRRGKRVFVTSGCDDHAGETRRLAKKTGVFSDQPLTPMSLLAAIRAGKTLALQNNVMLEYISTEPGFAAHAVSRPFLKIKVRSGRSLSGTTVRVFRDGVYEPANTAALEPVAGKKGHYLYSWTDNTCGQGEHNYVIFVGDILITSPICLKVSAPASAQTSNGYDDFRPQAVVRQGSVEDALCGAGKQIAFVSNREGENALYLYNTETRELSRVISLKGYRDSYEFSPDGNRVLLVRTDGTVVVLVINPETKKVEITDLSIRVGKTLFPSWLSDESFLFEDSQGRIQQADLSKEEPANLEEEVSRFDSSLGGLLGQAKHAGLIRDPKPRLAVNVRKPEAGSFLIAKRDAAGCDQLCVINEFGKVVWLTHGKFSSTWPTVGQMGMITLVGMSGPIAFCSNRSGSWDIYRAGLAEGGLGNLMRLTTSKANEVQPAWAFNAGKIYYTSDAGGHSRIYVMDDDGQNQHIVMR